MQQLTLATAIAAFEGLTISAIRGELLRLPSDVQRRIEETLGLPCETLTAIVARAAVIAAMNPGERGHSLIATAAAAAILGRPF
jgi:hypothetical protein